MVRAVEFAIGLFKYSILVWFVVLGALVVRDLLVTHGSLRGLLATRGSGADPERIALFMFTIGFALYYAITTATTPLPTNLPDGANYSLPDIPNEVLLALFGAETSYIAGKLMRTFNWGSK